MKYFGNLWPVALSFIAIGLVCGIIGAVIVIAIKGW